MSKRNHFNASVATTRRHRNYYNPLRGKGFIQPLKASCDNIGSNKGNKHPVLVRTADSLHNLFKSLRLRNFRQSLLTRYCKAVQPSLNLFSSWGVSDQILILLDAEHPAARGSTLPFVQFHAREIRTERCQWYDLVHRGSWSCFYPNIVIRC